MAVNPQHLHPLRESMENFEKLLNPFGYVYIPGICQTAATIRLGLAVTQIAIGLIGAAYHKGSALWAMLGQNNPDENRALRGRASEDLKWCEHGLLNIARATVEFFNFGWPMMVALALWDNQGLRVSHTNPVPPMNQLANRISHLRTAF